MANRLLTMTGAKIFIAPSQATDPANAAAYAALTWTEIKSVRSIGSYGDQSNVVEGSEIGDGRVRKAKGARNAGDFELIVYPKGDDPGQQALIAAQAGNLYYPIKVVLPTRLNETGTDSIDYFMGLVTSDRQNGGENDAIITNTFNVAITSAVTKVAATAGA